MLKRIIDKVIYYVFTALIFSILFKIVISFWDTFVPWNYKTDLIGLFFVIPVLAGVSFILSGLLIEYLRKR
ncbi:hypothetical protein KH172YL63_23040 [Bacillus sp. KH172YL63]|nr:hypothetical protein KH172YL63_23040 [Bacillus sp. KH172YL63]